MIISTRPLLILALISLAGLGLLAPRSVSAQDLTYTFRDVTFNDGAKLTGYFNFNPTTHAFGSYQVTTTNGVTDAAVGAEYKSGVTFWTHCTNNCVFEWSNLSHEHAYNSLTIVLACSSTGTGTSVLRPSTAPDGSYNDSGEATSLGPPGTTLIERGITAGSVVVTPSKEKIPVPDPSPPPDPTPAPNPPPTPAPDAPAPSSDPPAEAPSMVKH